MDTYRDRQTGESLCRERCRTCDRWVDEFDWDVVDGEIYCETHGEARRDELAHAEDDLDVIYDDNAQRAADINAELRRFG